MSFDLSEGRTADSADTNRAVELLDDARARRRYRLASTSLSVLVVLALCTGLAFVVHALLLDLTHVTPSSVGLVVTLTVSVTVLTIALLRSTFASSETKSDSVEPPSAEALKALGGALEAVGKVLNGKH